MPSSWRFSWTGNSYLPPLPFCRDDRHGPIFPACFFLTARHRRHLIDQLVFLYTTSYSFFAHINFLRKNYKQAKAGIERLMLFGGSRKHNLYCCISVHPDLSIRWYSFLKTPSRSAFSAYDPGESPRNLIWPWAFVTWGGKNQVVHSRSRKLFSHKVCFPNST